MDKEHARLFIRKEQTHFKQLDKQKEKSKAMYIVPKVVFIKPQNDMICTCVVTQ